MQEALEILSVEIKSLKHNLENHELEDKVEELLEIFLEKIKDEIEKECCK